MTDRGLIESILASFSPEGRAGGASIEEMSVDEAEELGPSSGCFNTALMELRLC
jgi:hypothetical protein